MMVMVMVIVDEMVMIADDGDGKMIEVKEKKRRREEEEKEKRERETARARYREGTHAQRGENQSPRPKVGKKRPKRREGFFFCLALRGEKKKKVTRQFQLCFGPEFPTPKMYVWLWDIGL